MAQLTPKQERFAQIYVDIGNASEAYRQAYESSAKPESVHVAANRVLKEPSVAARVQEIRGELEELSLWRRVDSINVLSSIARDEDPENKNSDRIAAVKELNSMFGWKRQEVKHSGQIEQPLVVVVADDDED